MGKAVQDEVQKKKEKFEDAIALTGFGLFNLELLFASGGTLMVVIIETMAMMFIVPASQCDLQLTLGTKGILSAISFLGVVSSSHFWGFIADTKGRRNILITSMFCSFITSLLSSISPQAWLFILIRYLNGVAVGGASSVVYAYLGEFHDKIHRPKVVSWVATFVAFGNMIIPGFAWLILPLEFEYDVPVLDILFKPWRLLIICYGTSSLIFGLWLLLRFPESPKYLLADGKAEDALEVLKHVYSINTGNDPESYPVSGLISDECDGLNDTDKVGILRSMWNQTVPLFKRPHGIKTFMVCVLQFTAFACSSGLLMWYPELLNMMTIYGKTNNEVTICGAVNYSNLQKQVDTNHTLEENFCIDQVDTEVFLTSLLIGCVFAVIYLIIGAIINIVGAKNLLLLFTVVTTTCGIGAQYIRGLVPAEALMAVFLTEATCIGIVNAITVELFPTQLRAMALAISLMAGRVGAVVGANLTGSLIYNVCDYLFYIFGADHLVLVITVLLLPAAPSVKKMIEPNV